MNTGPYQKLWQQALERYLEALHDSEDYEPTIQVDSIDELSRVLHSLSLTAPGSHPYLNNPFSKLEVALRYVDGFVANLAVCIGADASLRAATWGSIRMHGTTTAHEEHLNRSLIDIYGEFMSFHARTILFFRRNPHPILRKNAGRRFRDDFSRTIVRVKDVVSDFEREAHVVRTQKNEARYREALNHLNPLVKLIENVNTKQLRYNNLPFSDNTRFSGRDEILDAMHARLSPQSVASSEHTINAKSFALFGLGGVGKTQIAAKYAYRNLGQYNVILWVAADSSIALHRSFLEIAKGLELLEPDDEKNDVAVMGRVRGWLNSTKTRFLIIFDNVSNLSVLNDAWPATKTGSVLLTTRDIAIASSGRTSKRMQVGVLPEDGGGELLLKAVGMENISQEDATHASAISRRVGGLPLALTQIAVFVKQRKLLLQEVLPLYETNSPKINDLRVPGSDYEHTLSTVWDNSFDKLTETSVRLLYLLSFFEPGGTSEEILLKGSRELPQEFAFLSDQTDLGDAAEELIRSALVDLDARTRTYSVHRLVQAAARTRLSEQEHITYFDVVVHMLCWGFPDHSSTDIGHQIASWERCGRYLPQVIDLAKTAKLHKQNVGNRQKYADLLLRCSWYLYEREEYLMARRLVDQAVSTFEDTTTLIYASAIDLGGLIDLDLTRASEALGAFKHAFDIRKAWLGPDDPFIAYSLNNIALAYTEMGELNLAYAANQDAIRLRLAAKSDRIGNSYSNMSSLLLRMGRPDDAEEMLKRCPSLKDFTDETFLATGNPRFSGDMVLLSRIRLAQNRIPEALRLATKALAFRRQLLGDRLKVCDSQYDVACMLLRNNQMSSSIQMLEKLVSISETLGEGGGQQARALYKLSGIYEQMGTEAESAECKNKALELLVKLKPELKDAPYEEESFSRLCPWMLW